MRSTRIDRQSPPSSPTRRPSTQVKSLAAIIVGLPHADSQLDPEKLSPIFRARNQPAYGIMTTKDVESIVSWLRSNPDVPDNPYKSTIRKDDKEDESSIGFPCMRASVSLGLFKTESGIPRAEERAHERMDTLKCSAEIHNEDKDTDIKRAKSRNSTRWNRRRRQRSSRRRWEKSE